MTPADITLAVFTVCNSVRVVAYVPQITRTAVDQGGAQAISFTTWGIFLVSNVSATAYALVNKDDWTMASMFVANAVCCAAILAARRLEASSIAIGPARAGLKPGRASQYPRMEIVMKAAMAQTCSASAPSLRAIAFAACQRHLRSRRPEAGAGPGRRPAGLCDVGAAGAVSSPRRRLHGAAAAGEVTKAGQMLSPAIAAKSGPEAVELSCRGGAPVLCAVHGLGSSISVTRTADAPGFVFYMYMVTKTDEMRPFVIYVIEEGGAKVVANVLVDRFVEGRHCARVAQGWKCPDFG